jgi:hypothetical protein
MTTPACAALVIAAEDRGRDRDADPRREVCDEDRRRARGIAGGGQHRPREQERGQHDPVGQPAGVVLDASVVHGRVAHELHDPPRARLPAHELHGDVQVPVTQEGRGVDHLALLVQHGHRLPGELVLVDQRAPLQHPAVDRDPVARVDRHHLAAVDLLDRHLDPPAPALDPDGLGDRVEQV